MQYEKLKKTDIKDIKYLQPDGWPDITEAFKFYTANNYCNPIKISIDNKIIGTGCSVSFEKTAWLAHIIVNIDYRKRGIGSMIVEYLLNDIKKKGIETSLLIATELGEPVYLKAGFRKVSDYCYFKKENNVKQDKISDKIGPYKKEYYSDIIQLDTFVSGENREQLLKQYIGNSLVYLDNNVVCGFYIPNIGEGPIIASMVEAGLELMRLKYSNIERATIPSENYFGIEFLKKIGFVETETKGTRMISGKEIIWKPEMIYSRIGGNCG